MGARPKANIHVRPVTGNDLSARRCRATHTICGTETNNPTRRDLDVRTVHFKPIFETASVEDATGAYLEIQILCATFNAQMSADAYRHPEIGFIHRA